MNLSFSVAGVKLQLLKHFKKLLFRDIDRRAKIFQPLLLPRIGRPVYTESMSGVTIALSEFLSKRESREAVDLVHFMGGSARSSFSRSITHLIAEAARGENYRVSYWYILQRFCGSESVHVSLHVDKSKKDR